jgi:glycosyltransferase involved in cell wall biosynthesis
MRVLIDGVFFQLAKTGIARVWTSVISQLVLIEDLNLFMLDRGRAPALPGVELLEFPSYTMTYTAADSLLIQEFCDKLDIDVFTSTYFTSATKTPQVQLVYDMIPEVMGFDLEARAWKEKKIALSYASAFACLSKNTLHDLRRFFPGVDRSRAAVTYCGVDVSIFKVAASDDVMLFRQAYDLEKPYFLLVGSREQHKNYKNGKLLFDAVAIDRAPDFDIVCVGGEAEVNASWVSSLASNVNIKRLDLSDPELALAYSGALALVYPSLYEGFGMPVVEAMACGCPVITTHYGSLEEVAGGAALVISGHDRVELLRALEHVRDPQTRRTLVDAGLAQAAKFQWGNFAELFYDLLVVAKADNYARDAMEFHRRWTKLRTIQAQVDIGLD